LAKKTSVAAITQNPKQTDAYRKNLLDLREGYEDRNADRPEDAALALGFLQSAGFWCPTSGCSSPAALIAIIYNTT
jgi:hypothetical protein